MSSAETESPGNTPDMISLRLWPPFSVGGLSKLTVSSAKIEIVLEEEKRLENPLKKFKRPRKCATKMLEIRS